MYTDRQERQPENPEVTGLVGATIRTMAVTKD